MVAQKIEQPPEQLFQATRTVHPPLRPRIALARQREMNAQFKEWVDIVSTVSYPWPLPLVGVPTCFTEVRHMKKKSTTVAEMRRLLDNMPDDALLVFKDREQKFQKMTPFDIGYLPHKHQNKKQRKDTRRQLRIVEGFKNQKEILKFATTNEAGGVARYFKGGGPGRALYPLHRATCDLPACRGGGAESTCHKAASISISNFCTTTASGAGMAGSGLPPARPMTSRSPMGGHWMSHDNVPESQDRQRQRGFRHQEDRGV